MKSYVLDTFSFSLLLLSIKRAVLVCVECLRLVLSQVLRKNMVSCLDEILVVDLLIS